MFPIQVKILLVTTSSVPFSILHRSEINKDLIEFGREQSKNTYCKQRFILSRGFSVQEYEK